MNKILIGIAALLILGVGYMLTTQSDDSAYDKAMLASVLNVEDERLTKGEETAPVKIVEYTDILCPSCARANEEVIPQIEENYVETGKAHYEVRVVAMITPDSQRAAEGAYCAAEQDKFWEYLDTAYTKTWQNYYSKNVSPTDIPLFSESGIASFARGLDIDIAPWEACMASDKYVEVIEKNQADMRRIKAYGTPHFVINGTSYSGAPPYSAFKGAIDAELAKTKE